MRHHIETESIQQGLVFRRIQAGVVELLSAIRTDRLAMARTGIEHQESGRRGVAGKHIEHVPLIVVPKEEKAVPGKNPVKLPVKRDASHIPDDPFLCRHPAAAERNERWRRIDPGDPKPMPNKIIRDRHSRAAPKVQDRRAFGQAVDEPIMPGLVIPPRPIAIGIPFNGVPLIDRADLFCEMTGHAPTLAAGSGICKSHAGGALTCPAPGDRLF